MMSKIYLRQPRPFKLRFVKRYRGARHYHAGDEAGPREHELNKFGHDQNDCPGVKAIRQQNWRRRQPQHKQRGGHQPHQLKPGGHQQQTRRGQMWGSCRRPSPKATPIVAPGRQMGSTGTPTLPKFVLRVFLGSAAGGIFLCETNRMRSLASYSRLGRSSLRPSPPKPDGRRTGPGRFNEP